MKIGFSTVVTLGLLFGAAACNAQISNGGFELPVLGSNSFAIFSASMNPSGIPNWMVTHGDVDVDNVNSLIPAYQGQQSLDLDGFMPGTIQQTFATIVGQRYFIDFAYGNNPVFYYPTHSATVSIFDGTSTIFSQSFSHDSATIGNQNWMLFSNGYANSFVADSAFSTLVFASTDPVTQQGGIELDAISVNTSTPTPEFGTMFSLGSLLLAGGTGLWIKRRRSIK